MSERRYPFHVEGDPECPCGTCGEERAGRTEPPMDALRQAWPWGVYTTAYGLRIRHELTGTELDLYEAAQKLNDYDSERASPSERGGPTPEPSEAAIDAALRVAQHEDLATATWRDTMKARLRAAYAAQFGGALSSGGPTDQ